MKLQSPILKQFSNNSKFLGPFEDTHLCSEYIQKVVDLILGYFAGCGVATGWGAVFNNVKMEPQKSVAVFGLGALGLSVIQV